MPYFDETLRNESEHVYQILGGKSGRYQFSNFTKVFPNIKEENVVTVEGAGHWVHFDKPVETLELINRFIKRIDGSDN